MALNKSRNSLMRRIFNHRSASSTCSSSNSSSDDESPIIFQLTTEPDTKRDFCEFLNGHGVADLIKYVDFIEASHQLNYVDSAQIGDEINAIYNRHIRRHAHDKIFFDIALVLEIESKLTRKMHLTPDFYAGAVRHCLDKIDKYFYIFIEANEAY